MNDFLVGIFRVAESLDTSKDKQRISQHHYIGLVLSPNHLVPPHENFQSLCYMSETLFGLEKLMKAVQVIKWEEAEKELAANGFYQVLRTLSVEERSELHRNA